MKNIKRIFLAILFSTIVVTAVAFTEYFPDIIVTSPDGIWTDTRAYTTIDDAITAIGANVRDIYIVRQETTTALTIPANANLHFFNTGSIANSGQLTINSSNIRAPDRQIFTGAGDIDFLAGSILRLSWFSDVETAFTLTSDDTITLIMSEAATITANTSPGDDVNLKWEAPGNILTVNAAIEVGNLKLIEAGNYQILAGSGDFDFLDGARLKLDWFNRLRSINAWVESEEVTLIVSGINIVDLTEVVSASITLDMDSESGAFSDDGGAIDLTIQGNFISGPRQVFYWTGSGAVTFSDGAIPYVYPEMFGGASDGDYTAGTGTDNTTPFAQAIASGAKKIMLLVGEYKGNIILDSDLILEGTGQGDTILFPATDDAVIKTILTDNTVRVVIKNLRIDGTFAKATFTSSDAIRLGATTAAKYVDTVRIENVRIDDMGRYGLYCFGDTDNFVQDLYAEQLKIYDCTKAGLYCSGYVLEFLFNGAWFARNGDASNPNVEFVLDVKRANRINFVSSRFNHADYSTTGTAAKFSAVDQLSFKNCDFEEADIMLHVLNALSRNLGVKECNFGSTGNVTTGIYIQDINGAEIDNNLFASGGTMTTGILGDSAITRLNNIKIGPNVYSNVTTPVSITNNTTIDTGKIYAYQDYMRVNTEASAATDDLDYIYDSSGSDVVTGLQHGDVLVLRAFSAARDVVVKHEAGNISLKGARDFTLTNTSSTLTLKWDATLAKWGELSRNDTSLSDGSAVWDPASIADGDEEAKTVTVTGVALGDFVTGVSFSLDVQDLVLDAQVTAANTVTCILANNTGGAIDLGSGTVYVRTEKKD